MYWSFKRYRSAGIGLVLSLLAAAVTGSSYPLEIIELKGRQADEIVPIIQPFVGRDGAVTGVRNQLFIRSEPRRLDEIRTILEQIDRPPRKLMILVRQGRLSERDLEYAAGGVNLGTDRVRFIAGSRVPEDSVGLALDSRRSTSTLDADQRVQVVEGYPAYIAVGTEVPVRYRETIGSGGYARTYRGTAYRQAASGFTVIPSLNGDRVTLEISAGDDRFRSASGVVDTQRVSTRVQGRLGEWIALGGISEAQSGSATGLLHRQETGSASSSEIHLLVEEVP